MNTYKVTGYFKGAAYALYKEDMLQMLLCEFEKEQGEQPAGHSSFPVYEFDLLHSELFTAKKLEPKSVKEKAALFCLLYKHHKGVAYRTTKEDLANLKLVSVTQGLLTTYFTTTHYPLAGLKSIGDYIRHYNEVRDLATNGKPVKSAFPDVYDKGFEKTIGDDTAKLKRYWAHLRERGLRWQDGAWTQVK